MARRGTIDYSKWDKLTLSSSDEEEEPARAPPTRSTPNPTRATPPPAPRDDTQLATFAALCDELDGCARAACHRRHCRCAR
jgi:hypothetical protein